MRKTLTHTMKKALLLAPLILMLLLYILIPAANAQETTVEVNPSSLEVGETGVPTDPFTINITITDVTDLYDWQIMLYFNGSILNLTEDMMWLPADHVFAGKAYMETIEIGWEPSVPYPRVPYILYACTVIGEEETFTGTGTLCQINFTGIALGTSELEFSSPLGEDTFLEDSEAELIDFTVVDGEVTVIPEFPAVILIPVIMILTLVAVTIGKRSWPNKR